MFLAIMVMVSSYLVAWIPAGYGGTNCIMLLKPFNATLSMPFIHHELHNTIYYTLVTLWGLKGESDCSILLNYFQLMTTTTLPGRRLFNTANYNSQLYSTPSVPKYKMFQLF